jgi:hypothetical protein
MTKRKDDASTKPKKSPAPRAPDVLGTSERQRRAARAARESGRPLRAEEMAPGERGDGPYGDSEPGRPDH